MSINTPFPAAPPSKQPSRITTMHKIVFGLLAAFLLFMSGFGLASGTMEPERIETVREVEVEVEKEVIKEVEVPGPMTFATPDACADALDYADEGFGLFADTLDHIQVEDWDALDGTNNELAQIMPYYLSTKGECRELYSAGL